jgi:hypothetical protein
VSLSSGHRLRVRPGIRGGSGIWLWRDMASKATASRQSVAMYLPSAGPFPRPPPDRLPVVLGQLPPLPLPLPLPPPPLPPPPLNSHGIITYPFFGFVRESTETPDCPQRRRQRSPHPGDNVSERPSSSPWSKQSSESQVGAGNGGSNAQSGIPDCLEIGTKHTLNHSAIHPEGPGFSQARASVTRILLRSYQTRVRRVANLSQTLSG